MLEGAQFETDRLDLSLLTSEYGRRISSAVKRDKFAVRRLRKPPPRALTSDLLGANTQHHVKPHQLVVFQLVEQAEGGA